MSTSAAMTSRPAPPYPPPPPPPPPPPLPFPNLATWDYFFGSYSPSPPPQTREYDHPSSPSSSATVLPHLPISRVSSSSSSTSFVSTELQLPPPPPPPLLLTLPAQPLLRRVASPSSSSFSTELLPPPPPPPAPLLRRIPSSSSSSSSSSSFSTELLLLPPPPPFPLSPNSATWRLDSSDYFISTDPDTPHHTGSLLQSPPRPPTSSMYNSFVSDHRRGESSSQPASSESVAALDTVTITVSDAAAAACAVCTDALQLASSASRLPCGHLYHSHCIVQWLSLRNTCPVCRRSVPMLPAASTKEETAPWPPPLDPEWPTATDQEETAPPSPPQPTTASDRRRSLPGTRRIRRICRRLLSYME